uniref:Initiation factor 2 n=1 Tax=Cyanidiococcus yangmingshanensis TaxID=2690220 RepID=A0A7G5VUT9_9RHOD|nr:initiation factor 2 [Cyanidiococcus yangmingshanensis]QMX77456.1 initiation factor 2 [Cyanidiococcus yangmingshanensis]
MHANFIRKRSRSINRMDKCDEKIILPVGATLAELSKQTDIPITEFIRYVFTQGRMITLNDILDDELMKLFQAKYGFEWKWQMNSESNKSEEDDVDIAIMAVERLDGEAVWSNQVWSISITDRAFVLQMPKLAALVHLTQQIVDKDIHHPKGASMMVVESKRDAKLGVVTTILLRKSILKIGDHIEAEGVSGKIRALWNVKQQPVTEAKAGEIVHLTGFNQVLCLATAMNKGRKKKKIPQTNRIHHLCHPKGNLIVRSESQSGLENVCYFLVQEKWELLSAEVGSIRMQDIRLAQDTNSILVAWQMTARHKQVKVVEAYDFEQLITRLQQIFAQPISTITSKAVVKQVFRQGTIAGCLVTKGVFQTGMECQILRGNHLKATAHINEIKIHKQEVKEVKASQECGISMKEWNDWQVDDEIVLYN